MGLDTSHGCWHGAYSAFMRWREKLAEVAGLPPLRMMDGFYEEPEPLALVWANECGGGYGMHLRRWIEERRRPIDWACLKPDPLHILLQHSDCGGEIAASDCGPIADSLERLLPLLPDEDAGGHIGNWRLKTQTFIDGLRSAAASGEPVDFH